MTKVIILGEPTEQKQGKKREGKKIEFVKSLTITHELITPVCKPEEFQNIELICRSYDEGIHSNFDLMFAYDNNRNEGTLYLGHFNDGIV